MLVIQSQTLLKLLHVVRVYLESAYFDEIEFFFTKSTIDKGKN